MRDRDGDDEGAVDIPVKCTEEIEANDTVKRTEENKASVTVKRPNKIKRV
jgi:hypothetical protein